MQAILKIPFYQVPFPPKIKKRKVIRITIRIVGNLKSRESKYMVTKQKFN